MADWKIYKAEFSMEPTLGVVVSNSFFLAQDARNVLKKLSPAFLQQLRSLEPTEDSGQFSLVKLTDAEGGPVNGVFHIYEIKTIEEDTPVTYFTNHLGWVSDLDAQEIISVNLKYSDVHIIWERS